MAWGEPARRPPGDTLADAVRRYLNRPTTAHLEALSAALADHDARKTP